MLVNLQKTVMTQSGRESVVFEREIKIPIEPMIGMSIKGLEENGSEDSVHNVIYDSSTKQLTLIVEDSVYIQYNTVEEIKNRHSKWKIKDDRAAGI